MQMSTPWWESVGKQLKCSASPTRFSQKSMPAPRTTFPGGVAKANKHRVEHLQAQAVEQESDIVTTMTSSAPCSCVSWLLICHVASTWAIA